MAGVAAAADDVHRAKVKGLHGAERGGVSGKPWWRWCRVYGVHIVYIVRTGVRNRPFGQVGGNLVPAIADGGISGRVRLSYRGVGR